MQVVLLGRMLTPNPAHTPLKSKTNITSYLDKNNYCYIGYIMTKLVHATCNSYLHVILCVSQVFTWIFFMTQQAHIEQRDCRHFLLLLKSQSHVTKYNNRLPGSRAYANYCNLSVLKCRTYLNAPRAFQRKRHTVAMRTAFHMFKGLTPCELWRRWACNK